MTKTKVLNNLIFGGKQVIKRGGGVHIVPVLSGTGVCTKGGAVTLVAPVNVTVQQLNTTGSAYLTMTAGVVKGILVGTGLTIGTY